MKRILCYGDSNTWGMDPQNNRRFPRDIRWPGVLQRELGSSYEVIEEGLPGRTTVWDDPVEGPMNGKSYLLPCLLSHRPLDAVVLLLGTNDLKMRFSVPASDIAVSVGVLCDIVLTSASGPEEQPPKDEQPPKLVLLAPPPLGRLQDPSGMFAGGVEKSRELGGYYSAIAAERALPFLDLGTLFQTSDTDGVHFEADHHSQVGREVARTLQTLV